MKASTLQTLILGLLCLAVAGLAGTLYTQHQRIAELQTATSKRAQQLDTMQQDSNSLLDVQEALSVELKELKLAVDSGVQQANILDPLLDQWPQEVQTLRDGLATRAPETALAALRTRVEQTEQQLQAIKAKPSRAVAPPAKPKKTARPPRPAPVSPPFTVMGIESRGGERFLATAPLDSHSLAEVRLLHRGERIGSWHLKTLGPTTAIFSVSDQPDQIIRLP